MLHVLKGGAIIGINGQLIDVEVDLSRGMPAFSIVGMPDNAIKESRERVRTAILNSGHPFPQQRITINLAPAALKKEGAGFDLAIAAAIISAQYSLETEVLEKFIIVGELALTGEVKAVRGILPLAIMAAEQGYGIIVPQENGDEAAAIDGVDVVTVSTLNDMVVIIRDKTYSVHHASEKQTKTKQLVDFYDVKGHEQAKRAIEIAASGGHNLLMIGSPGSGKTMLARRIPTIMPQLTREESIETTKLFSVTGLLKEGGLITERPFRSPHSTASHIALAGGGTPPRPGEVSLAHNGVLFLDELPEFSRNALEVLRQPMEDNEVTVSRAAISVTFPSSFMMVAAMNPCPCGYLLDPRRQCTCSPQAIQRYQHKISGPLLDRIDIAIVVNSVPYEDLRRKKHGERSEEIRKRVEEARRIQKERFAGLPFFTNSRMQSSHIEKWCKLETDAEQLLKRAMETLALSTRGYARILKVSRTIADLEKHDNILISDIAEAVQYYDRTMFASE